MTGILHNENTNKHVASTYIFFLYCGNVHFFQTILCSSKSYSAKTLSSLIASSPSLRYFTLLSINHTLVKGILMRNTTLLLSPAQSNAHQMSHILHYLCVTHLTFGASSSQRSKTIKLYLFHLTDYYLNASFANFLNIVYPANKYHKINKKAKSKNAINNTLVMNIKNVCLLLYDSIVENII